jgi:hypothetical protein
VKSDLPGFENLAGLCSSGVVETSGIMFDFLIIVGINHPWQENHASTIPALSAMSFFAATQEIRSFLKTVTGTCFDHKR